MLHTHDVSSLQTSTKVRGWSLLHAKSWRFTGHFAMDIWCAVQNGWFKQMVQIAAGLMDFSRKKIFSLRRIISGQIIATSHDLTPNGGLVREIPLFQGNLGWWNIIIWPDYLYFIHLWWSNFLQSLGFRFLGSFLLWFLQGRIILPQLGTAFSRTSLVTMDASTRINVVNVGLKRWRDTVQESEWLVRFLKGWSRCAKN